MIYKYDILTSDMRKLVFITISKNSKITKGCKNISIIITSQIAGVVLMIVLKRYEENGRIMRKQRSSTV